MRQTLKLVLLAALFVLSSGSPLRAQELANVAKGFNPSASFAVGDVDSVNLFNGNLVIQIPLGQSYPVNGELSYGLTLVYNSQVWEYQTINGGATRTIPSRVANAGMGWMLSMGRLILKDDDLNKNSPETAQDTYMSPDGARHTLYPTLHEGEPSSPDVLYSRDGSYLRFKKLLKQIEFPDGTKHIFNAEGFPIEIKDSFENKVSICYDCCPWRQPSGKCEADDQPWPWKITDSHSREHWVDFRSTGFPNQPVVVDKVRLDAFNNQEAVYSFSYTLDDPAAPAAIYACKSQDTHTKLVTPIHLKSVTRPDSSSYTMPAHFSGTAETGPCKHGMIRQLGLPTLGSVEWDYATYSFPSESTSGRGFFQHNMGVGTRKLKDENGTVLGTWTYTSALTPKSPTTAGAVTLNALDQTIDKSTGLPISSQDLGGQTTTYLYDTLGRLNRVSPPEEEDTTYTFVKATPGTTMAQVTIAKGLNGPYGQSRITFDALGRPRFEEQRMPDGTYAKRETSYNALGWKTRVTEMDSPYATLLSNYDPFGRPATIQPPDGAGHNVTLTYAGISEVSRTTKVATSATAEIDATTKEVYDRHGRLYEVTEPNGVVTRYVYDVGNRLKKVCQGVNVSTGACGQERVFTYDNRGLLLWENHPEKTANTYGLGHDVDYLSYDARGHATRKVDGDNDLTFAYDKFERLTQVRETGAGACVTAGTGPRCLKSFAYSSANGTASNGQSDRSKGKLTAASRYNYIGTPFNATVEVKETYQYGGRGGRLSQKETNNVFNGTQSEQFRQTFTWNVAGELASHTYPDCSTPAICGSSAPRTQGYGYTRGRLTYVTGFANAITYHPSGLINAIVRTNGTTDRQTADPNGWHVPPRSPWCAPATI